MFPLCIHCYLSPILVMIYWAWTCTTSALIAAGPCLVHLSLIQVLQLVANWCWLLRFWEKQTILLMQSHFPLDCGLTLKKIIFTPVHTSFIIGDYSQYLLPSLKFSTGRISKNIYWTFFFSSLPRSLYYSRISVIPCDAVLIPVDFYQPASASHWVMKLCPISEV